MIANLPFIITMMFSSIVLSHGQCNGEATLLGTAQNLTGKINYPNHGNVLRGKRTCVWKITRQSSNQYVLLYLRSLQLYLTDDLGNRHCLPSHNLTVNGERIGCNPSNFETRVSAHGPCMKFQNSQCVSKQNCTMVRPINNTVEIRYDLENGTEQDSDRFQIIYNVIKCGKNNAAATSFQKLPSAIPTSAQSPATNRPPSTASMDLSLADTFNVGGNQTTVSMETTTVTSSSIGWDSIIVIVIVGGGISTVLVVALCCKRRGDKTGKRKSKTKKPPSQPTKLVKISPIYSVTETRPSLNTELEGQDSLENDTLSQTHANETAASTITDRSDPHVYASINKIQPYDDAR